MKRIYITFGGKAYDETTERIVKDAPKFGVDEVRVYDDRWLLDTTDFFDMNRWLFTGGVKPDEPKKSFGFGWCSWKAWIIQDALYKSDSGSVVLYTDADTYPIADLSPIFDGCSYTGNGIFLFESQGCPNDRFTRKDCFIAMGLDDPKYYGRNHASGRFQVFCKSWPSLQFLAEWWAYAINPMCQTVAPSKYGEDLPGYHRHSNEQSILTLLAHKYEIPLHREACQFGWPATTHPEDTYPQLFHQQWCSGDRGDLSGSRFRNVS